MWYTFLKWPNLGHHFCMYVHCTCQCQATIRTRIRTWTRIRTRTWIRTRTRPRTWPRIRFWTRTSGLWTHLSRRVVHKLCRGWSNWYQNHSCHWLQRRPWRLPWWPWGLPWRLACPQFWSWRELNWCDVNVHPFACSCWLLPKAMKSALALPVLF